MLFTERPNLLAIKFLSQITYASYKSDCLNEAENNGTKKPTEKDMKTWYSSLQQFCKTNLKTKGVTTRIYSYSQNTPAGLGGRMFSGGSMQGIWGKYRGLLMRGIGTDIDMKNCHPVLLRYICREQNIPCPNLEYYINHRDECLAEFDNPQQGKMAYLVATNNDVYAKGRNLPQHFKKYDKEMKQIQKQLVNLPDYTKLKDTVPDHKLLKNYNGSVINRILCYYENVVLQHCIEFITSKGIEIAILMFDGLMVYGNYYDDDSLLREITEYIDQKMPELNMKWAYKQHDDSIHIPDDFDETAAEIADNEKNRCISDDNHGAEILYQELKDILIPSNGQLFYKKGHIWTNDEAYIQDHLLNYILNAKLTKKSDNGDIKPYSQFVRNAKNIREALLAKIKTVNDTHNLEDKFHETTKGRLCFKDGVLDFKARRFYTWDEIDFPYYSVVMIPRDFKEYFDNPNREVIELVKDKVYRNLYGENHLTKALNFFSRGIAGHCEDKVVSTYTGKRNCGKGVQYGNQKYAFGDYVSTFELGHIMYQRKSKNVGNEASRMLYWILELQFVRLAVTQETPEEDETGDDKKSNMVVNGKLLKKMAGGEDEQVARRNFDRKDTHCKIETTFQLMGNGQLDFDVKDVKEQLVEFYGVNQFKSQTAIDAMVESGESQQILDTFKVADPNIKDYVKTDEWANATVYLYYEYYINHAVEIEKDDEEQELLIAPVRRAIIEKFEFTNNPADYVLIDTVLGLIQENKKKIQVEMESMGIVKRKIKKTVNKDKWAYFGIKMNHSEKEEDDDMECDIED